MAFMMGLRPLSMVMALGLVLSACDQPERAAGPALKVGLIAPGSLNDHGWNALANSGLQELGRRLGAVTFPQEVRSASRHEAAFRAMADEGLDLIIGHGAEFLKPALEVGAAYPKIAFVVSAGSGSSPNVASIIWRIEDAAYLAGWLAAKLTKTGKAGCIGGQQYAILESVFHAFAEGGKSVRPDFDVRVAYNQSWHDFGMGKSNAESMIAQGCDFLFHNADEGGLGVLKAAAENGCLAFGCIRDQAGAEPEAVLASVVQDASKAFLEIAREVQEGRFRGRVIEWGRKQDMVSLVFNPRLEHLVPATVRDELTELDRRIASDQLKVPYDSKVR
jgi:basic membrane lipoprotein Med (substrate-binding protein (PBP1-ABC) superfamily)